MVKIAQDMGATPPEGSGWGVDQTAKQQEAEAQKQAILAKIQEALGAETIAAQQKAEADAKARQTAENEVRQRQEMVDQISDMAESVGVDRSVGQKMVDRLEELSKRLQATLPEPKDLDKQQMAQIQAQIEAEVETIAVETMGEKGHEFMKKFKDKM